LLYSFSTALLTYFSAHPFTLPLKDDKQCIPHVLYRALLPPVQP